ncbi:MAG: hypothetical protein RIF44_12015, partial [Nitratireductor sp.]
YKIPVAKPARHREESRKTPATGAPKFGLRAKAGKLQPPALQSSVSEQKPENSSHRRSKVRSQSTKRKNLTKSDPVCGDQSKKDAVSSL